MLRPRESLLLADREYRVDRSVPDLSLAQDAQRHVPLLAGVTVDPHELEQEIADARLVDPRFHSVLSGTNRDHEAVAVGRPFGSDRDAQLVAVARRERFLETAPVDP